MTWDEISSSYFEYRNFQYLTVICMTVILTIISSSIIIATCLTICLYQLSHYIIDDYVFIMSLWNYFCESTMRLYIVAILKQNVMLFYHLHTQLFYEHCLWPWFWKVDMFKKRPKWMLWSLKHNSFSVGAAALYSICSTILISCLLYLQELYFTFSISGLTGSLTTFAEWHTVHFSVFVNYVDGKKTIINVHILCNN